MKELKHASVALVSGGMTYCRCINAQDREFVHMEIGQLQISNPVAHEQCRVFCCVTHSAAKFQQVLRFEALLGDGTGRYERDEQAAVVENC